mgnify:CR=1 FL=1
MESRPATISQSIQLVVHSGYERAFLYCEHIDRTESGTLAFVVGASGVGKTQLSKMIGPKIYKDNSQQTHPWIRVSLQNGSGGYFSSKDFIVDVLAEFRDPFRGLMGMLNELPLDLVMKLEPVLGMLSRRRNQSEGEMRKAVAALAKALDCRMMILDEANIMILTKGGRLLESHVESIRTLSIDMKVRTILFGTIAVLAFMGYSAQINRITHNVHFDRIRDDSEFGMIEFLSFLDGCERDISLENGLLSRNADAIYEASYGIPGEVVSLLERASAHSFVHKGDRITLRDLEASYPPAIVRKRMREEADLVERVMKSRELDPREVLALLREQGRVISP